MIVKGLLLWLLLRLFLGENGLTSPAVRMDDCLVTAMGQYLLITLSTDAIRFDIKLFAGVAITI